MINPKSTEKVNKKLVKVTQYEKEKPYWGLGVCPHCASENVKGGFIRYTCKTCGKRSISVWSL